MFFDDFDIENNETKEEQMYMELIQKAAGIQRQLFALRYNYNSHKEIKMPMAKKGLFSKEVPQNEEYDNLLKRLDNCKNDIRQNRGLVGIKNGLYWWEIPWEQIEEELLYDLVNIDDYGSRRFQREYKVFEQGNDKVLVLEEEGHISQFSSEKSYSYDTYNNYSQEEIDRRKRNLAALQICYDLTMASYDGKIVSGLSGAEYKTGRDYVLSAENFLIHDYAWDRLNSELYTNVETNTLRVTSNSIHYKIQFAVAAYKTDNRGQLNHVQVLGNKPVGSSGSVPEDVVDYYGSRDAAVMLAMHLANDNSITKVPFSLFGGDIKEGSSDYNEAMRQAKIYTCLANKL